MSANPGVNEMTSNDKTLNQLIEIARTLGVEVKPNTTQTLARQRQKIRDALKTVGVRIENTMAEKIAL